MSEGENQHAVALAPASVVERWFVDGPDPVESDEPHRLAEVLLPWPVRCAAVLAVGIAAWIFRNTGLGQQGAWGLQVGALALVSIVASYWWHIAGVDCFLAALWFVPIRPKKDRPNRWHFLHGITFVNRQIGHVKALLVWILVAFAGSVSLPWQLTTASGAVLLGPAILNRIARTDLRILGSAGKTKANGALLWRRRILIYLATVVGLLVLALLAPRQLGRLWPLIAGTGLGLALRIVRHRWRNRKVAAEVADAAADTPKKASADGQIAARATFRKQQADAAYGADALGPWLVIALLAALVVGAAWQRRELDRASRSRGQEPALAATGCGMEVVLALSRKMRELQRTSNALYLRMVEAHAHAAALKLARGRLPPELATFLEERTRLASAIDTALIDDPAFAGPVVLPIFRLNDAVLTHARWFNEEDHRKTAVSPVPLASLGKGTKALERRIRLAPARIAWARRHATEFSGAARQIVEFEETERFKDWEKWCIEFETALVAWHNPSPDADPETLRWRLVVAASALGLYVGEGSQRHPYAQDVARGLVTKETPANIQLARPDAPKTLDRALTVRGVALI